MKVLVRLFIYIIFITCLFNSCANRVTPTGGSKDVKPPVAVTMLPPNYSVNFTSRKVELKFDEYVQLSDLQKRTIARITAHGNLR